MKDYSHLGAVPVKDYSHLGAVPVENKKSSKKGLFERIGEDVEENINKPFERNVVNPIKEGAAGFAQGMANIPAGIANLGISGANLLPGVDIEKVKGFKFAPETPNAMVGEAGAFFTPGGVARLAGKVPEVAKFGSKIINSKPVKEGVKYLEKSIGKKATKALGSKPAQAIAENTLVGAIMSPDNQASSAGIAGGLTGAMQVAGARNPIINAAGRAATGGGLGYIIDGKEGAAYGSMAGLMAPTALKKLGIGGGKPGRETLEHINQEEVKPVVEAGLRLGRPLDPGEASGDPYVGKLQGIYGRHGEAAALKTKIGIENVKKEKKAINKLMKTISPKGNIASYDIREAAKNYIGELKNKRSFESGKLYEKSESNKVATNKIKSLENSDATIKNAINHVMEDPAYAAELKGYSKNTIKVLDYAKRRIDAQIEQAKTAKNFDRARVLNASKDKLVNSTDEFNKDYKQARATYQELSKPINEAQNNQIGKIAKIKDINIKNIPKVIFDPAQTDINVLKLIKSQIMAKDPDAWNTLVKNQIAKSMFKQEIKGSTFHKSILDNDNTYEQFLVALEHNPKATQQLKDMKLAWKNLINIGTPKGEFGKSEMNTSAVRETIQHIFDMYHDMTGNKRNIKALKFIHDPRWIKKFSTVQQITDKKIREEKMLSLFGRSISGFGLAANN